MVAIYKRVLENPVYSEIIFRLGIQRLNASELVDHFKPDELGVVVRTESKERSTLSRQLWYLVQEGFLKEINITPKGKKGVQHNKKVFCLNLDKLLDTFFDYYIEFIDNYLRKRNLLGKKESTKDDPDPESVVKIVTDPNFRKKAKKNTFVRYSLIRIIEEMRHLHINLEYLTLKDVFDIIFMYDLLADIDDKVEKQMFYNIEAGLYDKQFPELKGKYFDPQFKIKGKHWIYNYMNKDVEEDYTFYVTDFAMAFSFGFAGSLRYYLSDLLPMNIADLVIKGLTDRKDEGYKDLSFKETYQL